jgi:hypothetical protein
MRYKVLGALLVAFVSVHGMAWANGPSGSSENKKTKQVKCAKGNATPAGMIYLGPEGFESCSDDGSNPDGRVIISFQGQYITADGDPSNASTNSTGFIRLDSSGPSCGDAKHTDATAGKGGSCG